MVVEKYGRSGRHLYVVVNGVPDLGRRPLPDGNTFTVAGLGRLSEEKGVVRFLDTARELRRRHAPVRMAWQGWGPLEERVRAETSVVFMPASPDVSEFLDDAHILLSPSWRDSMTLTIIEAMSVGRPVVATDVGSVGDLVVDGLTGRLLPKAASATDLADAVLSMLDPTALRAMGAAARHRYESYFTVEHMCRSVDQAYAEAGLW